MRRGEVNEIMRAKRIGIALAGAALAVTASSPAWAGTVYQGSDYSYVTNSNRNATICDKEADARTAYTSGASIAGYGFRVNDQDGSSGYCWYKTIDSGVANHITCEDINNWPDACGSRSYH
jgi:hypothetical protein